MWLRPGILYEVMFSPVRFEETDVWITLQQLSSVNSAGMTTQLALSTRHAYNMAISLVLELRNITTRCSCKHLEVFYWGDLIVFAYELFLSQPWVAVKLNPQGAGTFPIDIVVMPPCMLCQGRTSELASLTRVLSALLVSSTQLVSQSWQGIL